MLPILCLRGLSTGDFRPALQGLLGDKASRLSPSNIARLKAEWENEYEEHRSRSLAEKEYVYVCVDGIHFNVRLEDEWTAIKKRDRSQSEFGLAGRRGIRSLPAAGA